MPPGVRGGARPADALISDRCLQNVKRGLGGLSQDMKSLSVSIGVWWSDGPLEMTGWELTGSPLGQARGRWQKSGGAQRSGMALRYGSPPSLHRWAHNPSGVSGMVPGPGGG